MSRPSRWGGRQIDLTSNRPAGRLVPSSQLLARCKIAFLHYWSFSAGCLAARVATDRHHQTSESGHQQCDKKHSPLATNGSCRSAPTALTFVRSLSSTTAESVMFQIRRWSPQVASRSGLVAVLQQQLNTHCVSQNAAPASDVSF